MLETPPRKTPEKNEILDDNARKFVLGALDYDFLQKNAAVSFDLIVDWLERGADNEKKVAYKRFDNGDVQTLLISKLTQNGDRTTKKATVTDEEYQDLLNSSILHLEKRRHEFEYTQNDMAFSMKYDEFTGGELYILEVDAPSENERNAFNPNNFPAELTEVTGDVRYYGYRVADMI